MLELMNGVDTEVEDGDVIWCLRASPDMGHEIEILSVGSPLMLQRRKWPALFIPKLALPACIDSGCHCLLSQNQALPFSDGLLMFLVFHLSLVQVGGLVALSCFLNLFGPKFSPLYGASLFAGVAPMLARRVKSTFVSGCLSPFALESGCLSPSLRHVCSVVLVCTGGWWGSGLAP